MGPREKTKQEAEENFNTMSFIICKSPIIIPVNKSGKMRWKGYEVNMGEERKV